MCTESPTHDSKDNPRNHNETTESSLTRTKILLNLRNVRDVLLSRETPDMKQVGLVSSNDTRSW